MFLFLALCVHHLIYCFSPQGDGEFERAGDAIRLPDDVTLGFLAEHRLGVTLTRVPGFHSHLEPLRVIPRAELKDQVRTIGIYACYSSRYPINL